MTFDELLEHHDINPDPACQVGDGWVPIVDHLLVDLGDLGLAPTRVARIKEKWGELRVDLALEHFPSRPRSWAGSGRPSSSRRAPANTVGRPAGCVESTGGIARCAITGRADATTLPRSATRAGRARGSGTCSGA